MKPVYLAVCDRCYTAVLAHGTNKRKVEVVATSHITAYGHGVSILVDRGTPKETK